MFWLLFRSLSLSHSLSHSGCVCVWWDITVWQYGRFGLKKAVIQKEVCRPMTWSTVLNYMRGNLIQDWIQKHGNNCVLHGLNYQHWCDQKVSEGGKWCLNFNPVFCLCYYHHHCHSHQYYYFLGQMDRNKESWIYKDATSCCHVSSTATFSCLGETERWFNVS